jgi:hypothetical protein
MRWLWMIFVLVLVMLSTGCDSGEVWGTVMENLLPIVSAIVLPVLLILVRKFIQWLEIKLDFEISEAAELKILSLIEEGIRYAEEQAKKALKDGEKLSAESKLGLAIEYVVERCKDLGLPELARDKLVKLIEAKIVITR